MSRALVIALIGIALAGVVALQQRSQSTDTGGVASPQRKASTDDAGAAADRALGAREADCGALAPAALDVRLEELSPNELDQLLSGLQAALPTFDDRLRELTLARVGVPYALGTLGEESADDPDPVFRLDEADCTVLVLTTAALAHARSSAEAVAWMGPANYHADGAGYPVRYDNRQHFTSDRLQSSPLFVDLTTELARPEERTRVELTLNRTSDGEALLPIDWQRDIVIDFVPAEHAAAVLARAPRTAGIAFVRTSMIVKGLVIAHEGVLLDGRCLVHASSTAGAVVQVDVIDYLFRRDHPDPDRRGTALFDGVMVYGFRDASGDVDVGGD